METGFGEGDEVAETGVGEGDVVGKTGVGERDAVGETGVGERGVVGETADTAKQRRDSAALLCAEPIAPFGKLLCVLLF